MSCWGDSLSSRNIIMGSTDTDIDDLENATYKYLLGEQTEKMWQRLKGMSSCVHDSWAKQALLLMAKQERGPGSIATETGCNEEESTWTKCFHTLKSR
ncbi:hypothetical protein U0070_014395 [Myodes glareolus]|uniref:Uncharacterized protein n=1 Tax=Myodes glareolus TaxID=447135 RepID=A0AAW0J7F4_MYOGA